MFGKQALRRLQVGDPAPDFTLPSTDGGSVRLADLPRPTVISFLRHRS